MNDVFVRAYDECESVVEQLAEPALQAHERLRLAKRAHALLRTMSDVAGNLDLELGRARRAAHQQASPVPVAEPIAHPQALELARLLHDSGGGPDVVAKVLRRTGVDSIARLKILRTIYELSLDEVRDLDDTAR